MKIILTGASGNLGEAIQRKGHMRHTIIPIGRHNWHDVPAHMSNADVVVHAASDLKTPVALDPDGVIRSNINSTVDLLKMLDLKRRPRMLFISSCAVYGHSEITREDVPPAPISLNGITKFLNERLIAEFCTQHEISFNVLRAFNTFGGRDRFSIIHRLEEALKTSTPFVLYNNGLSQRDFIHVEDVAAIVLKLIERPTDQRILNVGSGEAIKIKDIVAEFRRNNPQLKLVHREREEAEYSRANITRLRELFPEYEFRSVLAFVRGLNSPRVFVDHRQPAEI